MRVRHDALRHSLARLGFLRCHVSTAAFSPSFVSEVHGKLRVSHPQNNVPPSIVDKLCRGLHLDPSHPIGSLKTRIQSYFEGSESSARVPFRTFDRLSPIVSCAQNFDDLLVPVDHVSRRASDTYYVNDGQLLRCHMTAHQTELLRQGERAFLMAGDVFRRDEIDATHYPAFHQLDGVRVWTKEELAAMPGGGVGEAEHAAFAMKDLKRTLTGLVEALFGRGVETRWVDAHFPFTDPSLELEVRFGDAWLEVLGSGVIRQAILKNCAAPSSSPFAVGWAFGLGLERLAMVLHDIPDIRLFWSKDERFLGQFREPLLKRLEAAKGVGGVGGGARLSPLPSSSPIQSTRRATRM